MGTSSLLIYITVFVLSFVILSLQVILGVVFSALSFPFFFTISFSLMGLSLAGLWVYIRYHNKTGLDVDRLVLRSLPVAGTLLVLYTVWLKSFSLMPYLPEGASFSDDFWNRLLLKVIFNSMGVGLIFVAAFFSFGVIYALIYKYGAEHARKIYFCDLAGASLGCVFGTLILNVLQPSSVLFLLAFFIFLLTGVFAWRSTKKFLGTVLICALGCLGLCAVNIRTDFFEISVRDWQTKQDLNAKRALRPYEEMWHRWNIYARTSLIKWPEARDADEKYVFSIVGGRALLKGFDPDRPPPQQIPFTAVSLGFLLDEPKDVLVLMAGAGYDMLDAYNFSQGRADITGVELNPLIVRKAQEMQGYHLKEFFALPNVHMAVQEGRSYVESTDKKFDTIILSWSGATAVQYLGIGGHTVQHLYTQEAFESYLRHLKPGGTIVVVNRNKIKVLGIAKAALERLGYKDAAKKIIVLGPGEEIAGHVSSKSLLDSFENMWVVIRNADFTPGDIERIRGRIAPWKADFAYQPYYVHPDFSIYRDLLQSPDAGVFLKQLGEKNRLNFLLARDDAPFIHLMAELNCWRTGFWKGLAAQNRAGRERFFHGFMIKFLILLTVTGAFLLMVLSGLRKGGNALIRNYRALIYFLILGLGYIFVEVTIMHVCTLLMGNPVYSFSVVLASLLLSTGLGSLVSDLVFRSGAGFRRLSLVASLSLAGYYFLVISMNPHILGLPLGARILLTAGSIFPLGFVLGMFFPQGIKVVGRGNPDLVPFVWGINGYMSIIGSALCITISPMTGFAFFLLFAAVLYAMILFFYPRE